MLSELQMFMNLNADTAYPAAYPFVINNVFTFRPTVSAVRAWPAASKVMNTVVCSISIFMVDEVHTGVFSVEHIKDNSVHKVHLSIYSYGSIAISRKTA